MGFQDLRYGLRALGRRPGFTAIAMITLALGIGANTAIFSIIQTVLIQPLPFPHADRLAMVMETTRDFAHSSVAYPNLEDWRRMNASFTELGGYRQDDFVLAGGSAQPEHLAGDTVSANLFSVLGVNLLRGSGLSPAEDRTNGAPQVVITYDLWQRRFNADPKLVGETIPLNGRDYAVVGILPPSFWFPSSRAEVYTPLGQYDGTMLHDRGDHPGIEVVGRLKPGVSLAAAQGDMNRIGQELARSYPKDDGGAGVSVQDLKESIVGNTRPTLLLLLAAVGLVLLIACANVANLLLARATGRRRELAVRSACGASAGRIIRQLLTESLLLGLGGGVLGLALAYVMTRVAPGWLAGQLPRITQIGLNGEVLGFTLMASLLSSLLFGMIPAWQSRRLNLQEALKDGGRSSTGASHRTQNLLAVAEVALSLMLLAGAVLLVQSLLRLNSIDPGFKPNHVLTMQVALSPEVLTDGAKVAAAHEALLARVNHLPGVVAAAETSLVPLGHSDSEMGFWIGGKNQPPANQIHSAVSFITSPGYLRTMQIPLLRGRYIGDQDRLGQANVVVIDTTLARDVFPGQDPVGQHLQSQFFGDSVVIGVVGHVKFWGLGSDASAKIQDQFYMPINQIPLQIMTLAGQGASLMVRTAGDPLSVLGEVRTAVAGPNRDQPVYSVETMDGIIADSLSQQKFLMALLGAFAVMAVTLAAIGIYGVLSYSVEQRRHEVGLRMALGADKATVLRQMVGEGGRLAALGAGLGLMGAIATTRFLAADLYGVKPGDPWTLSGVAVFLVGLAALASYVPARRAAQVDPVIALRGE